jgi:hypothetical protein
LLDTSQELVASPSNTRTEESPWPHTPMQVPLLDQPEPWAGPFIEPLTEPFVGQYEERPHEPTKSDTVDATFATNDRVEVQDAMDDGTGVEVVMRLQTEEAGVTIGRISLRTSLAQGYPCGA